MVATMRAWAVGRPGPVDGGPLEWVERPVPEPGPGQVRVRLHWLDDAGHLGRKIKQSTDGAGGLPTGTKLHDLADENQIKIDAGCRAGNCGSCLVAIKSGTVEYLGAHADVEDGSCLACVCRPASALVIDA